MPQIHDIEGWLCWQLAAQPWVKDVARFSDGDGKPTPVGLAITGTSGQRAAVGMVLGASTTHSAAADGDDVWATGGTPALLDAAPDSPLGWADSIAALVRATAHPLVAEVTGYPGNGTPGKAPGVKILLTDGSAAYATVLPTGR